MTFHDHLHRYLDWLKSLEDAPSWQHVRFVKQHDAHGGARPVEVAREALLTPEAFESEFERCMDGRFSWINLECLGVIDDTLYLTTFVSSQGPLEERRVPRDRIAVNFSGPEHGPPRWDGRDIRSAMRPRHARAI